MAKKDKHPKESPFGFSLKTTQNTRMTTFLEYKRNSGLSYFPKFTARQRKLQSILGIVNQPQYRVPLFAGRKFNYAILI